MRLSSLKEQSMRVDKKRDWAAGGQEASLRDEVMLQREPEASEEAMFRYGGRVREPSMQRKQQVPLTLKRGSILVLF